MDANRHLGSGLEAVALFTLLVVRGWLLWLVIPIALLGWLVTSPIRFKPLGLRHHWLPRIDDRNSVLNR